MSFLFIFICYDIIQIGDDMDRYVRKKGKSINKFIEDYVVVDIETSGLSTPDGEIIEIGAAKFVGHNLVDQFQVLIKPNTPITPFITNLTGITNELLEDGLEVEEALLGFVDFIGDAPMIGHNVHFDLNFLYDACLIHLGVVLNCDYIDTLTLARKHLVGLPNHKLTTICYALQIEPGGHRGLNDAIATALVYQYIVKQYQ